MGSWDLHPERLATTNELGGRVFLYPTEVRGRFQKLRLRVRIVLMFVFLVLPWLRIDGRQALLLDVPNRHFEIFGMTFRAHDAPLIFFLLAGFAFGLIVVTAIWGRVWCGWACPQTVFIDGVFRRLENWIEGPPLTRKKADASGELTANLALRKALKWIVFTFAALIITHSFLAYFIGTDRLLSMIQRPPEENKFNFMLMASTTAALLFNFGWFREQFCLIMCPYGRLQSVLMDEHSLVVGYDTKRGEPRKMAGQPSGGDCVNCYRCVQVCPTGIDIRRGTQMECIACTACIDACDDVMTKIKKPKGLIRYTSEINLKSGKVRHMRFRTVVGLLFFVSLFSSFAFVITGREAVQVTVLRGKGSPYQLTVVDGKNGFVLNHFEVEFSNQDYQIRQVSLKLSDEVRSKKIELVVPQPTLSLQPSKIVRTPIFLRFPKEVLRNGQAKVELIIEFSPNKDSEDGSTKKTQIQEVTLVGPYA